MWIAAAGCSELQLGIRRAGLQPADASDTELSKRRPERVPEVCNLLRIRVRERVGSKGGLQTRSPKVGFEGRVTNPLSLG